MERVLRNSRKIRYNNSSRVSSVNRAKSRYNIREEESVITLPTAAFIVAVILVGLLLVSFQSYRINNANIRIATLQSQLKDAQMMTDSLEGKLLSKRNLQKVQKIATTKYGMVKPGKNSYVAVKINNGKDTNGTSKTASASTNVSGTTNSSTVSAYNSEDVATTSSDSTSIFSKILGGITGN